MESFYLPKVDFERAKKIEYTPFEEKFRHPFARDLSRLLHCPCYRRLQGKMQVFPSDENHFFRNRLTHSMEVGDVARMIAEKINKTDPIVKNWHPENKLNLDLISFAGNAHDLGHPPFGHMGERVLDECMKSADRFEGNAQTFRILSTLEKKQTLFDSPESYDNNGINSITHNDERIGLNLTYRSLLSVLKYDSLLENPKVGYSSVDMRRRKIWR